MLETKREGEVAALGAEIEELTAKFYRERDNLLNERDIALNSYIAISNATLWKISKPIRFLLNLLKASVYHKNPANLASGSDTLKSDLSLHISTNSIPKKIRHVFNKDASIIIPTKNAGKNFERVLQSIFEQDTEYSFEVICVDSGSTDGTLELIKRYNCTFHQIEPGDFGHGKTRNLGASISSGEFIIFITQDACPASKTWLQNFLDAMNLDKDIAGGFGIHYPYSDCNPFDKEMLKAHFKNFGVENTIYQVEDKERYASDKGYRQLLAFFSDNNSCIRRIVWEKHPYPNVDFAEDQIWAKQIMELGYKKVYCPFAPVYHSHNYNLSSIFGRSYDEHSALYDLHAYLLVQKWYYVLPAAMKHTYNDIKLLQKSNMSAPEKIKWFHYSFWRNIFKYSGGFLGGVVSITKKYKPIFDFFFSQQYSLRNIKNPKKRDRRFRTIRNILKLPKLFIYYIKNKGINTVVEKVESLHGSVDIINFYDYIIRIKEVLFNEQDYCSHKNDEILLLNWVIPEPGKGSGGHINIFRFVNHLENLGFHSRIYIWGDSKFTEDSILKEFVFANFDISLDVEFYSNIRNIQFAHATIATSWQTAYYVKSFNNTISKFYFVQDFEPYFYAIGSEYIFAENTYKFAFRGLTAGDWLKNKLFNDYGMKTDGFSFSYDKNVYRPIKKKGTKKRVFFYARPVTPRRSFELGILALSELCNKLPNIEIFTAGWDISIYKLPHQIKNLGIIDVNELSEIYGQCEICLIVSSTNLSLLPLEVMASNSVVMCNRGENNEWLLNENNCILVDNDVTAIVESLMHYLTNTEELDNLREKGKNFAETTDWVAESEKVCQYIRKGIKDDETKCINNRR